MKLKKIFSVIAKVSITIGIIYYLIKGGRLDLERISYLWNNPWIAAKIIFVFLFIILPVAALRWWVLLRGITINITFGQAGILTWIGNFFNSTLPGSISGDVVKGYYIHSGDEELSRAKILISILIDRMTGLFGLVVISFFAVALNYNWILANREIQPLALSTIILFCFTLLFYALVFIPFKEGHDPIIKILGKLPFGHYLLKIYIQFKSYQKQWKILMLSLALAIISHFFLAYTFLEISQLLGSQQLDLMLQLFIMPIGFISIAVPISPGGIGVGHAAFESLYSIVGIRGGANIFNLFVILQLLVNLCGGLVYLLYKRK